MYQKQKIEKRPNWQLAKSILATLVEQAYGMKLLLRWLGRPERFTTLGGAGAD